MKGFGVWGLGWFSVEYVKHVYMGGLITYVHASLTH